MFNGLFAMILALTASFTTLAPAPSSSLDGQWAARGFTAEVSNGHIGIMIVTPETSAIYWDGSVPADTDGEFESVGNRDVLDRSVLASRSSFKTFTYDGDTIMFVFTIMGTNTTVHLERS